MKLGTKEEKIKRIIELDQKTKLKPTEKRERENLIDDIVILYNPRKHHTTISGGGIVSLWFRHVEGNKKWKKGNDETIKPILGFEKKYKVKLFCKDLDNSLFGIKTNKNSLLVKK